MFFNLKNPIAVWYKLKKIPDGQDTDLPELTYGWEEFYKKIEEKSLPLHLLENTDWDSNTDFGKNRKVIFRTSINIGEYTLIDGLVSLHESLKLNKAINLSNYSLFISENNLNIFTKNNYDLPNKKLYFTAPKIKNNDGNFINVRANILSGKQPLGNTRLYRQRGANDDEASGDLTEGTSVSRYVKEIKKGIRSGFIENVHSVKIPFESHIFSLHDETADKVEIEKFGEDTYEILNLTKWIELINKQVFLYWNKKRPDFIGTFVMFGKIDYLESKENLEITTIEDLSNNSFISFPSDANYYIEGMDIAKHKIEFNLIEDCHKYHLSKPKKYIRECEHRLCIVPLYSNPTGDGAVLINGHDDVIKMDIEGYSAVIELKSIL